MTYYHHPISALCQECQGQPCPEGWTGPHDEEAHAAWLAASFPAPAAPAAPAALPLPSDFEVTRKQLLVALALQHGIRYADIQAQLAALYPDATSIERYVAECHLEDSLAFQRGHPLIAAISAQFGLSSDQVDDLFRYASTVE